MNNLMDVFAAKLVPVGYGIKKLQISCVVEDDKVDPCYDSSCVCLCPVCLMLVCVVCVQVGTDILEEKITAFEDFVQSMDVAAFNKI